MIWKSSPNQILLSGKYSTICVSKALKLMCLPLNKPKWNNIFTISENQKNATTSHLLIPKIANQPTAQTRSIHSNLVLNFTQPFSVFHHFSNAFVCARRAALLLMLTGWGMDTKGEWTRKEKSWNCQIRNKSNGIY